jgi:hypothetical protein
MAITNGYVTLAAIKAELGFDDTEDAYVEKIIEGASRWVDAHTRRRFYTTTEDETRYYSTRFNDVLFTDDILSVTTLKTDNGGDRVYANEWETTDYDLLPINAELDNKPYMRIARAPLGSYSFPCGVKTVQIVGKFGYCEDADLPDDVYRATFLAVLRLYKRDDTPLGTAGGSAVGTQVVNIEQLESDPDIIALLNKYKRLR